MSSPADLFDAILEETSTVVIGNEDVFEGLTISLLTGGHILLEGVPGVAKTTIANVFARATGLSYSRIQMTPDMVPADITGTNVYRRETGEFQFRRGSVFANLAVADEINRATPKTQSALLEAMEELTVTVDGRTFELPDPFVVIATQNPIEMEGVFELPEAQRDRFQFKLTVEIPDREGERDILDRFDADPKLDADRVSQVVEPSAIVAAREQVEDVYVSDPVKEYVLDVVAETRRSVDVRHGGSPRATLAFLSASKARAAIRGRDYVIPDDVKRLVHPILRHRIVRSTDAELSGRSSTDIIEEIVSDVVPPGSEASFTADRAGDERRAADGGAGTDGDAGE